MAHNYNKYFSFLRYHVRQPRAEEEPEEETFTAAAPLFQASHLVTSTCSRRAVHRGERQQAWRLYRHLFGEFRCRRGGTMEPDIIQTRDVVFTIYMIKTRSVKRRGSVQQRNV